MKLRFFLALSLTCAVGPLIMGCASTSQRVLRPEPRPLGADCAVEQEQPGDNGRKVLPLEPVDGITAPQALALGLLRNPQLAAFSYEVRAAEARALQAGLLPNPQLEVAIEEYNRDGEGFDSSETVMALGQVIELGNKRRWRRRIALAEGELAGWDYESKRLDIFTDTARRFIEVVAAQRRLELAKESVALVEKTAQAVRERVKAGKEPPLQEAKSAAEVELARMEAMQAGNGLAVSRSRLAAMWGAEDPHFQTAQGNLDRVSDAIPSLEDLRLNLPANPQLARWDAELRMREAALSSEKAVRIPDLQATVGLQSFEEDSTDALAFGVGVPLPLFDRNQGNIAAARHELAKAHAEKEAVRVSLSVELAEAHATLASAHHRVLTLRTTIVPAMQQAFEAAHEGYRQGKFGFLDMLDAQRSLLETSGELVDALVDYHGAIVGLERLTGTSIEGLKQTEMENQ